MSIKGAVETVSPTEAARYREKMVKNRPLSESVAAGYAETMRRGEWKVNGEGIIFDESGVLLDGQHRCRGVELYGKPVDLFVVRGVKAATFSTIDSGAKRTVGHVLSIQGYANANLLAGALGWAYRWENGIIGSNLAGTRKITGPLGLRLASKWADMSESVKAVHSGGTHLLAKTHFAFLHWATHRAKPSIAGAKSRGCIIGKPK